MVHIQGFSSLVSEIRLANIFESSMKKSSVSANSSAATSEMTSSESSESLCKGASVLWRSCRMGAMGIMSSDTVVTSRHSSGHAGLVSPEEVSVDPPDEGDVSEEGPEVLVTDTEGPHVAIS